MMFMYLLGIPMVLWCYFILVLWWIATKWNVKQHESSKDIQVIVIILQTIIGVVMLGIVVMISYVAIKWLYKHCMIIKTGFGPCSRMTRTEICVSTQGYLSTCITFTLLPIGLIAFVIIFFVFCATVFDIIGADDDGNGGNGSGGSGFDFGAIFTALFYVCCCTCVGYCLKQCLDDDCATTIAGLCCCIILIYVIVSVIISEPQVLGWMILFCCCLAYGYCNQD